MANQWHEKSFFGIVHFFTTCPFYNILQIETHAKKYANCFAYCRPEWIQNQIICNFWKKKIIKLLTDQMTTTVLLLLTWISCKSPRKGSSEYHIYVPILLFDPFLTAKWSIWNQIYEPWNAPFCILKQSNLNLSLFLNLYRKSMLIAYLSKISMCASSK